MNSPDHIKNNQSSSRSKWVLIGFLAVVAYFLWAEHKAHVIEYFPYLMLFACLFMHLFHHGGGHNHAQHQRIEADKRGLPEKREE